MLCGQRRIRYGIATVGIAVLTAGILAGANRAAAQAGDKPPPSAGMILIGEYGSMTGKEATFGQMTHKGTPRFPRK